MEKINDTEMKEGDWAINTEDRKAKPRLIERFSKENDTLGFHQPDSWFKWIPLGTRHKKVINYPTQ